MSDPALPYEFERKSPFYPLIINYLILLGGFNELAAAGLAFLIKELPESESQKLLNDAAKKGTIDQVRRLLGANPVELGNPLLLRSEQSDQTIRIDLALTMRELARNATFLVQRLVPSATAGLFIQAYESTSDHHDRKPLWEFLRHCRNAGAHGGRFHFLHGEPRRLAEWGRLRIEASLEGTYLAARPERPGFLAPGDALKLLWDIEQAYPSIIDPSL